MQFHFIALAFMSFAVAGGAAVDCTAPAPASGGAVAGAGCAAGCYDATGASPLTCVAHTTCGTQAKRDFSSVAPAASRDTGVATSTSDAVCAACAAGSYAATGADNCVAHTTCGTQAAGDDGSSVPVAGVSRDAGVAVTPTTDTVCTACASGSYAATGADNCVAHTTCGTQAAGADGSSGATRDTGGNTSTTDTVCAACTAGSYAATGADNCVALPAAAGGGMPAGALKAGDEEGAGASVVDAAATNNQPTSGAEVALTVFEGIIAACCLFVAYKIGTRKLSDTKSQYDAGAGAGISEV